MATFMLGSPGNVEYLLDVTSCGRPYVKNDGTMSWYTLRVTPPDACDTRWLFEPVDYYRLKTTDQAGSAATAILDRGGFASIYSVRRVAKHFSVQQNQSVARWDGITLKELSTVNEVMRMTCVREDFETTFSVHLILQTQLVERRRCPFFLPILDAFWRNTGDVPGTPFRWSQVLDSDQHCKTATMSHHITMPLAEEGSLNDFFSPQNQRWATLLKTRAGFAFCQAWSFQLLYGFASLKVVGVWHRDVKPKNILMRRADQSTTMKYYRTTAGLYFWTFVHTDVVVHDFGLAHQFIGDGGDTNEECFTAFRSLSSAKHPYTGFGTPGWMAPEMVFMQGHKTLLELVALPSIHNAGLSKRAVDRLLVSDAWSVGQTLFAMFLADAQTGGDPIKAWRLVQTNQSSEYGFDAHRYVTTVQTLWEREWKKTSSVNPFATGLDRYVERWVQFVAAYGVPSDADLDTMRFAYVDPSVLDRLRVPDAWLADARVFARRMISIVERSATDGGQTEKKGKKLAALIATTEENIRRLSDAVVKGDDDDDTESEHVDVVSGDEDASFMRMVESYGDDDEHPLEVVRRHIIASSAANAVEDLRRSLDDLKHHVDEFAQRSEKFVRELREFETTLTSVLDERRQNSATFLSGMLSADMLEQWNQENTRVLARYSALREFWFSNDPFLETAFRYYVEHLDPTHRFALNSSALRTHMRRLALCVGMLRNVCGALRERQQQQHADAEFRVFATIGVMGRQLQRKLQTFLVSADDVRDGKNLLDLLQGLLSWNVDARTSVDAALQSPFFSQSSLAIDKAEYDKRDESERWSLFRETRKRERSTTITNVSSEVLETTSDTSRVCSYPGCDDSATMSFGQENVSSVVFCSQRCASLHWFLYAVKQDEK
jgi:serine/threonine protein kinase